MQKATTVARRTAVSLGVVLTAAAAAGTGVAGAAPRHKTLYVSPHGKQSAACTRKAPCKTITRAVSKARKGDTVTVGNGTYAEDVKVTKDIRLVGTGKPVINATGLANGIMLTSASADGALVRGFLVRNATYEGILAFNTSRVTISNSTVTLNDQGVSSSTPTGECAPQGVIPGDCGEGLHLMSVTHSTVRNNNVSGNAGGILITDETGPAAYNTITGNTVTNNVLDCGITLAGHNPKAVLLSTAPGPPTVTGLAPTVGGIYSNVVSNNTVNGNGTKGQGGGVLLAGGPPGTGVYNNTVRGNTAEGNGLGGVTLHSHAPGQDLNGNTITQNILSNDGVNGYPNGAPGDSDAGITQTVGIIIWSAVSHLTGTAISGNQISNEYYGIWTQNVPPLAASLNTFAATVKVPIYQK